VQNHYISGLQMRDLPGGMDDWKPLETFGVLDSRSRYQRVEASDIIGDERCD
jgi:hypothetical protein